MVTKPRMVLVEFGSHLFSLQQLALLVHPGWDLDFAIRYRRGRDSWRTDFDQFNRFSSRKLLHADLPQSLYARFRSRALARVVGDALFLVTAIFRAIGAQRIYITTGPEHPNGFGGFGFWLLSVFFGDSIVLNVRDASEYGKVMRVRSKGNKVWILFTRATLRRIERFTFETIAVERSFLAEVSNVGRMAVVLDKYSDAGAHFYGTTHKPPPGSLVVGVLGTIDSGRRDYGLLIDALECLPEETRSLMRLNFLTGPAKPGTPPELLPRLSQLVETHVNRFELSGRQLYEEGQRCHVLISPNRRDQNYGYSKGSGAFGDATLLQKMLLLPAWSDPGREFSSFCKYYRTADQLSLLFGSMVDGRASGVTALPAEAFAGRDSKSIYRASVEVFS